MANSVNIERFKQSFEYLGQFGRTEAGGLTRPALSTEDKMARDTFCQWLKEAGLTVRIDDVGNIYGRREGLDDNFLPVVMGSHLDTVYQGGRFDGITGVLSGLEVIRSLNDKNIRTKRPIEICVFTNEEGTRFEPSMLGSGVLAGEFQAEDVYKIKDKDGITFLDELKRIGYLGEKCNRLKKADSYFEMHVEQGPVLEHEGLEVGVLTGIRGMVHLEVTISGIKDHAGPSPMEYRRDAMMGAANMIAEIENIAYEVGKDTTTTVGKIFAFPCSSNVIPKEVKFSVDVRNEENEYMDLAVRKIKKVIAEISQERGLVYDIEDFWRVDAIHFPKYLVDLVETSVKEKGYKYKKMVSGAGHDASYISMFAPTTMLFVPSIGGLSHCEEEYSKYEDIEKGISVLYDAVLSQANRTN